MLNIRPVSDLRNKFTEIQKIVEDNNEPVFLTSISLLPEETFRISLII